MNNFQVTRAAQERLIKDGICPPRISALQSKTFKDWQAAYAVRAEWADAIVQLSKTGNGNVFGPGVINQHEGRDIVGQAENEVLLGTKSVDAAAEQANKLLNALLTKEKR